MWCFESANLFTSQRFELESSKIVGSNAPTVPRNRSPNGIGLLLTTEFICIVMVCVIFLLLYTNVYSNVFNRNYLILQFTRLINNNVALGRDGGRQLVWFACSPFYSEDFAFSSILLLWARVKIAWKRNKNKRKANF